MANDESLDNEIKELLLNYKCKKSTSYEPCTEHNIKECLIGLHEEFGLLNITYIFNPYIDINNGTLNSESLVKLINSCWTLLNIHKNVADKVEKLVERNHTLESTNKQLDGLVNKLKERLSVEKNESRACIASAQRISNQSEEVFHKLSDARSKIIQVSKQKGTCEKILKNEITRLKLENEKLTDRLRISSGSFTPCSEVCDSSLLRLKEKDKKQQAVIAQLQRNNHELLTEIVAIKEDLVLGGLCDFKIDDRKK